VTETILQRIDLRLQYPVTFTRDAFASTNPTLAEILGERAKLVAFIDDGVAAHWPGLTAHLIDYVRHFGLALLAPPEVLPGGDRAKQPAAVETILARLAALRVDRHCFVLAIGGGAMLDVVGYAAATFHRGVRLVRFPTTVLAQDDAGIGVKNGVNAFGAKNVLGTFAAPFAVINDSSFLATLEARDRIAGMAEAVKVALIRDASFFEWLVANAPALCAFELPVVETLIRRCAELHLAHIARGGDPFEQGNARPLDYGHWAAHKLETLTDHAVRHGEAVAIGMVLDAHYAALAGLLPEAACRRIVELVGALGLPAWHELLDSPALLAGLDDFREHLGGELCITLLADIGRGIDVREIDATLVRRAVDRMRPT
jgi:3-dehydroquinate synthase